ncbi:MAG: cache domain-containing protein [Methanoregula sp.]|nr:cache domain-containing protein [Methanoregula sp.]
MKPGYIAVTLLLVLSLLLVAAGCTQPAPATVTPSLTVPAAPAAPAAGSSTKDEMVTFVKEATAYAQSHDKNASLAEFSNRNGSFVRGDLYIYAYDFNGITLAHPFNPEKIGVNRINETDALGTLFITNLRDAARNGSGFVEFAYINPANNYTVEKKLGYVEKVDNDWWLGSGIYFGPVT